MTATSLLRPGALDGPEAARVDMLGVEWARYGVRATAIEHGPRTDGAEIAQLVAYLAFAGGEYFSGCRFDLR